MFERRVDGGAGPDTARAAPSLDKRRFRTRRACLAPLLLGDQLCHFSVVDLIIFHSRVHRVGPLHELVFLRVGCRIQQSSISTLPGEFLQPTKLGIELLSILGGPAVGVDRFVFQKCSHLFQRRRRFCLGQQLTVLEQEFRSVRVLCVFKISHGRVSGGRIELAHGRIDAPAFNGRDYTVARALRDDFGSSVIIDQRLHFHGNRHASHHGEHEHEVVGGVLFANDFCMVVANVDFTVVDVTPISDQMLACPRADTGDVVFRDGARQHVRKRRLAGFPNFGHYFLCFAVGNVGRVHVKTGQVPHHCFPIGGERRH